MNDTLEYIDAYFNGRLGEAERKDFELRCTSDTKFAEDVAFYIAARGEVRNTLIEQKQEKWKNKNVEKPVVPIAKTGKLYTWLPYMAAACLLLAVALYYIFQAPGAQKTAVAYLENNYGELSQTMDASRDSLQLGIAAYNKKNYNNAGVIFNGVRNNDSTNSDAIKYAGLTYLQMNDYEKALQCFTQLSAKKGLFSNNGDILTAATLIKRNSPGDEERAKTILQKVVREGEAGSADAQQMLNALQ